jgi:hypothetical protein
VIYIIYTIRVVRKALYILLFNIIYVVCNLHFHIWLGDYKIKHLPLRETKEKIEKERKRRQETTNREKKRRKRKERVCLRERERERERETMEASFQNHRRENDVWKLYIIILSYPAATLTGTTNIYHISYVVVSTNIYIIDPSWVYQRWKSLKWKIHQLIS